MMADQEILEDTDMQVDLDPAEIQPKPQEEEDEEEGEETNIICLFPRFSDLPPELRDKIWDFAGVLPRHRIVNLCYSEFHDQLLSHNTSNPAILHISHGTRVQALESYALCFGTKSCEPRIYFDPIRDVLLLEDYLEGLGPPERFGEGNWQEGVNLSTRTLKTDEMEIEEGDEMRVQRLAVNASFFLEASSVALKEKALKTRALALLARFSSARELFLVVENVNPYSKGPIRFFDLDRPLCTPLCGLCYTRHQTQPLIENLRAIYGKMIKIRFVGAYRGFDRLDLGCYEDIVPIDPADDDLSEHLDMDYIPISEADVPPPTNRWDVDLRTIRPDEERYYVRDSDDELERGLNERLKMDVFRPYTYYDVEETFSDHGDDEEASQIPEAELNDLREEERLYREALDENEGYGGYLPMLVDPKYFEVRDEL